MAVLTTLVGISYVLVYVCVQLLILVVDAPITIYAIAELVCVQGVVRIK